MTGSDNDIVLLLAFFKQKHVALCTASGIAFLNLAAERTVFDRVGQYFFKIGVVQRRFYTGDFVKSL